MNKTSNIDFYKYPQKRTPFYTIHQETLFSSIMKFVSLWLLYICTSTTIFAQNTFTLSGTVRDAKNGELLIGVNIYNSDTQVGTSTNAYGFYSITVHPGSNTLSLSYVGYEKKTIKVDIIKSLHLNIDLQPDQHLLDELTVSSIPKNDNIKNIEISVSKITMQTVKKMPALLGEVDVLRSIQFLPGVSTVGEGAAGFNVRGGTIDQNLVLLDEAPVYNSSHLMGFFSIFNPDVVKDVKLIKGGIPVLYGGRISSILDVRMRDGNNKNYNILGGIGTIFSRISLEGPIVKEKGSFVLALRRSYIDLLAKPFLKKDLKGVKFYFYDFTAKGNYKINDKNTLYLSGYFGRDVFGADFGFSWGNATTTLRWNKVFNQKLFLNTTTFYSKYDYSLNSDLKKKNDHDAFRWNSSITNYSIKPDFTWYIHPKNTISFGAQTILYHFNPGAAKIMSGGEERSLEIHEKKASESAIYVGNEQKLTQRISLNYGLRISSFNYFGAGEAYAFSENSEPGKTKPLSSVTKFEGNKSIQRYHHLEPRIAINGMITPQTAIKIGYNRLAQYLHLLSNTMASSPLDVWVSSTNNIKPQFSDQIAIGLFNNRSAFEGSIEVYYKMLKNQIDYTPEANLLLNKYVEGDLLLGKGRAYGAELFIKKTQGKFTGWISYTLARTERRINGLNQNKWFLSRIDRLHNLSVVTMYDLSKRLNFGATFSLASGTPASFPTSKYIWQGVAVPHNYYDERNTYRIPSSHRLDLSATLKNKRQLWKKAESEWVFSVYNVYNRRNAFSVYVRQNPDDPSETQAVRYSVFASILPAITYNFKF